MKLIESKWTRDSPDAPNETQRICGSPIHGLLIHLPANHGMDTKVYPVLHTKVHIHNKLEMTPANLPLVQVDAWLKRSSFHWHELHSSYFCAFNGIDRYTGHIKVLTIFNQQTLNENNQAISLMNSEFLCLERHC